jgi:glycosyltransferase involved in cell wall biosynthesis
MGWLILQVAFWLVGALWLLIAFDIIRNIQTLHRLPPLQQPPQPPPKLSILIAVRDEALRIEKTVRQILAQQHVDLQLIVINDRSRDASPDILNRLSQEDPRLKVLTIDTLPENWLGKCHAMHVGGQYASGEWLLFTDGDIWLAPDVAARAITSAKAMNVEHLTLTPRQHLPDGQKPGALYESCMLIFHMAMGMQLGRANRDRPNSMCGIGAFNLIRADVYKAIGGHESLRLEVADDMKLGLLVRRLDLSSRAMIGDDAVEADWASDIPGIKRALEKNMWSGLNFSLPLAILATLLFIALWGVSIAAWFFIPAPAAIFAALGLPLLVITSIVQALKNRWRLWPPLLTPLAGPIVTAILWNSVLTTLRQGGVRWRDTFYPLATLRAGMVK